MQRIEVDDRTWAVGFWWQQREKSPRKQVADLNEQIGEEAQRLYNVYVSLGELVGVGHSDDPKGDSRLPSLAGAFVRVYGETLNVLVLLRFDDGNAWLFALKDGIVLPQGDLYSSAEELQQRLDQYRQNKVWNEVIETEGSAESVERIREITGQLGRRLPSVQPVASHVLADTLIPYIRTHPKLFVLVGLVLVVLVAGIYGINWYQQYKAEQARMEQLKEKRREIREKRERLSRSPTELKRMYFPPQWRKEPPQHKAVADCYRKVGRVLVVAQGWEVKSVACLPGQITVTRKRSVSGTFVRLPRGAEFQIKSPSTVTQIRKYSVSERDTARDLVSRKRVSANLYELTRQLQCAIKLSWAKPEPKPVEKKYRKYNPDLPKKIQSPYWHGEWRLKGVPEEFLSDPQALSAIPGLVVGKLKRTSKDEWRLEGEVYATAN